jgi:hypothetical protein
MSKKAFNLAVAIVGALTSVSGAIVAYCEPPLMGAIIAAIGVADTAVIEILSLFKKEE